MHIFLRSFSYSKSFRVFVLRRLSCLWSFSLLFTSIAFSLLALFLRWLQNRIFRTSRVDYVIYEWLWFLCGCVCVCMWWNWNLWMNFKTECGIGSSLEPFVWWRETGKSEAEKFTSAASTIILPQRTFRANILVNLFHFLPHFVSYLSMLHGFNRLEWVSELGGGGKNHLNEELLLVQLR